MSETTRTFATRGIHAEQPVDLAAGIIYGVSIAQAVEAAGHRLVFDHHSLNQLVNLGNASIKGIKARFAHPSFTQDGLGSYLGRFRNFRLEGEKALADLHLSRAAAHSPAGDLRAYILSLAQEDPESFGVSIVVDLQAVWTTPNGETPGKNPRPANALTTHPVARITRLYGVDVVDDPALNPSGLFQSPLDNPGTPYSFTRPPSKEIYPMSEEQAPYVTTPQDPPEQPAALAAAPPAASGGVVHIGGTPPRAHLSTGSPGGLAQFQSAFDWIFGASSAPLPPPDLRNSAHLYRLLTGDIEHHGVFRPEYAFANANTTTLADLAVNAMNKVIVELYANLIAYRWYELITDVQPTDGTLHDMAWIQFGGIANLPTVAEGAAYTELTVGDTKETSAFYKYGGYVGITDKMLRNSEIAKMQAIPKALAVAAVRTRSAAIASIFTQASGTGPTLAQDSTVLFHANHSNVATTAYSWAAWKAARLECAKHAEPTSAKRLMLWPKYWLGPADLYDQALIDFGYGQGPGGRPGEGAVTAFNDVNPYAQDRPGDPRPIPLAVPEFTDTGDWAYIVDPRLFPVICMAYANGSAPGQHPAPELFTATDPTGGLLFTNDTLPIKVRDQWAYGVATYRGIGKRNVA